MDVNSLFQKIQRLIKEHELVRKENERLKIDLAVCQKEKQQLVTQFSAFETQVAAIQIANKGMSNTEKDELGKRINRYIKEIDKAITLLNG